MGWRGALADFSDLAFGFVEDDGDGGGEVEGAGGPFLHGDADGAVVEPGFGEAFGFTAEDEEVIVLVLDVPSGLFGLGAEEPEAGVGVGLEEFVEAFPDAEVDVLPVVEADAPDRFFVKREAQGFDEVEGGSGGEGESSGGSGVVRDLGFDEDDVHGGRWGPAAGTDGLG